MFVGARFGASVGVSGDTAVVGAYASGTGNAYVFVRSGGAWQWQATLSATGAASGDQVGYAAAVSGNTAVVGAPAANASAGVGYVFTRAGTTWTQAARLLAPSRVAGDAFGSSVSVDGDSIAVGSPTASCATSQCGAAHVFGRNTGGVGAWGWTQAVTAAPRSAGDTFGNAVSISNNTLAVAAQGDTSQSGAVHVFTRAFTGASWVLLQKTRPASILAGEGFGSSVGIHGDWLAVGAWKSSVDVTFGGAAFVYYRNVTEGAVFARETRIVPSSVAASGFYGCAVAATDDNVIAGAYNLGVNGSAFIAGCPLGYTGATCATGPLCDWVCQHGGSCAGPNSCACTGGWTGVQCDAVVQCPTLSVSHGTVSCPNGRTFAESCSITCDTGYVASPATVQCTASGAWSATASCSGSGPAVCPVLGAPTNGFISPSPCPQTLGTNCSFGCGSGYLLLGSSSRICGPTTFSGDEAECANTVPYVVPDTLFLGLPVTAESIAIFACSMALLMAVCVATTICCLLHRARREEENKPAAPSIVAAGMVMGNVGVPYRPTSPGGASAPSTPRSTTSAATSFAPGPVPGAGVGYAPSPLGPSYGTPRGANAAGRTPGAPGPSRQPSAASVARQQSRESLVLSPLTVGPQKPAPGTPGFRFAPSPFASETELAADGPKPSGTKPGGPSATTPALPSRPPDSPQVFADSPRPAREAGAPRDLRASASWQGTPPPEYARSDPTFGLGVRAPSPNDGGARRAGEGEQWDGRRTSPEPGWARRSVPAAYTEGRTSPREGGAMRDSGNWPDRREASPRDSYGPPREYPVSRDYRSPRDYEMRDYAAPRDYGAPDYWGSPRLVDDSRDVSRDGPYASPYSPRERPYEDDYVRRVSPRYDRPISPTAAARFASAPAYDVRGAPRDDWRGRDYRDEREPYATTRSPGSGDYPKDYAGYGGRESGAGTRRSPDRERGAWGDARYDEGARRTFDQGHDVYPERDRSPTRFAGGEYRARDPYDPYAPDLSRLPPPPPPLPESFFFTDQEGDDFPPPAGALELVPLSYDRFDEPYPREDFARARSPREQRGYDRFDDGAFVPASLPRTEFGGDRWDTRYETYR